VLHQFQPNKKKEVCFCSIVYIFVFWLYLFNSMLGIGRVVIYFNISGENLVNANKPKKKISHATIF
jgi:hypothetical protein